ncbi:MAG: CDP-alcohol phosphatidyltransferase family protein [Pseudomonadota bacterium]
MRLSRADLPNVITILRMAAVIPLTWLLVERSYGGALLVFFVAGVSDAVDGFLAKRFNWESDLGGILDPLADKLLLLSCYLVLGAQGWIPVWLLLLVLGRDLVIVAGALAFHYWIRPVTGQPLLLSKANTFLQIVLVLVVLLALAGLQVVAQWQTMLVWAVTASTVLSGVQYVVLWGVRALIEVGEDQPDRDSAGRPPQNR